MNAGHILGIGLAVFAFAPVLGIATGLSNTVFYLGGFTVIAVSSASALITTERESDVSLGAGGWALIAFAALVTLHSPGFRHPTQWEALLSVFLCALAVVAAKARQPVDVVRGLTLGVVAIGLIGSVFSIMDYRFAEFKVGGWVDDHELSYLLLALPVAASVGPLIIFIRSGSLRARLLSLAVLVIVGWGVTNMLSRTAVVTAVATGMLAMLFGRQRRKISTLLSGFILAIPLAPFVFVSIVQSNAGLSMRFERMLDPAAELYEGGRGYIWARTFDLIGERPLFGWGVQGVQNEMGDYPHNAILEAWGDLGLAGLAAVGLIFVVFFVGLIRTIFKSHSPDALALHLIGLVVAVESLKSHSLYLSRATLIILVLAPVLCRSRASGASTSTGDPKIQLQKRPPPRSFTTYPRGANVEPT